MEVKLIGVKGTWREIADAANTTVNREAGEREPSPQWKRRIIMSEHSMIRQLIIKAKWYNLKSWVSVHLVRHKIGIEHWVRTQRTDRTQVDRDSLPQGSLIEHEFEANAQSMISISRKRLCNCAAAETRQAWEAVLEKVKDVQPELYRACVPDCIYRGWCYEFKSCGYHKTPEYREKLLAYREGINE